MRWFYLFSRFVLRVWCRIWLRAYHCDEDNIPLDGPVILAANHSSHLDPLVLGVFVHRRVWYVARSSLEKMPLANIWMRSVGIIFIDRKAPGREAIGRVIQKLAEDEAVGMFPEGTRSKDGGIGAFQRGLLLLLKKSHARVVPVGIRGTFAALPPGKFFPRPRRCSVHFGKARSAEEVLAPGGLEALRQEVAALSASELA